MLFAPKSQLKIFCIAPGFLFVCSFLFIFLMLQRRNSLRYVMGPRGDRITNFSGDPHWLLFFKILKSFILLTQRGDILSRVVGSWPKIGHSYVLSYSDISILLQVQSLFCPKLQTNIVFTKAQVFTNAGSPLSNWIGAIVFLQLQKFAQWVSSPQTRQWVIDNCIVKYSWKMLKEAVCHGRNWYGCPL